MPQKRHKGTGGNQKAQQSKTKREGKWKDAIIEVLKDAKESMSVYEIAEAIEAKALRNVGANPSNSIAATIANQLKNEVIRVERGLYMLKANLVALQDMTIVADERANVVKAYGILWDRRKIDWAASDLKIMGQFTGGQSEKKTPVNFAKEDGVYVLYDRTFPVYVGRTTTSGLGRRLLVHTKDRLSTRWDRFSWFGFQDVNEYGGLMKNSDTPTIDAIITAIEALLIEAMEPPLNRRRGDEFSGVEYIQAEDPEFLRQRKQRELEALIKSIKVVG